MFLFFLIFRLLDFETLGLLDFGIFLTFGFLDVWTLGLSDLAFFDNSEHQKQFSYNWRLPKTIFDF